MVRNDDGALMPLGKLASVSLAPGRYAILHDGARRVQIVTCNVAQRDLTSFVSEAQRQVDARVSLPSGNYLQFTGAVEARAQSVHEFTDNSLIAAVIIASLLYIAFGGFRNLLLVLVNIPFALMGGIIAALMTGGCMGDLRGDGDLILRAPDYTLSRRALSLESANISHRH
jgi:Cu/Ag efflux pump CusA